MGLLDLNIDIVDHCNLNCACCGHFSPLATKHFININRFEDDCRQMSKLTNRYIGKIVLLGGEPLLHPQISELLKIARHYFEGSVGIDTNGIMLPEMSESFWHACRECSVIINVTRYPINIDYNKITTIGQRECVRVIITGEDDGNKPRRWFHNFRDASGTQDIAHNFKTCKWHGKCLNIEDGKICTCVVPLKIRHLNRYFGEQFTVSGNDYLDIHSVSKIEDILDVVNKPIPFCRYCLPNTDVEVEWSKSKHLLKEWI